MMMIFSDVKKGQLLVYSTPKRETVKVSYLKVTTTVSYCNVTY